MNSDIIRECISMSELLNHSDKGFHGFTCYVLPAGDEFGNPREEPVTNHDRWVVTITDPEGEEMFSSMIGDTFDSALAKLWEALKKECVATAEALVQFVHD